MHYCVRTSRIVVPPKYLARMRSRSEDGGRAYWSYQGTLSEHCEFV